MDKDMKDAVGKAIESAQIEHEGNADLPLSDLLLVELAKSGLVVCQRERSDRTSALINALRSIAAPANEPRTNHASLAGYWRERSLKQRAISEDALNSLRQNPSSLPMNIKLMERLCLALGDDPKREGNPEEWLHESPYAVAAEELLAYLLEPESLEIMAASVCEAKGFGQSWKPMSNARQDLRNGLAAIFTKTAAK